MKWCEWRKTLAPIKSQHRSLNFTGKVFARVTLKAVDETPARSSGVPLTIPPVGELLLP
jgi:hypothetical protein